MHFTEYDTRLAAYAIIIDDAQRVLLSWYNGRGRDRPGWTLPGGGVEFDEGIEAAVIREVSEETGYDVALDAPLATHSFTKTDGPRPYKSARFIYAAHITGGSLGTLEVEGSTDFAEWLPLRDFPLAEPRAGIVDIGLAAAGHPLPTPDTVRSD